ncbi:MAG: DNA repair protein RadC [Bacteroidales bacterium]|jgi:DNA repair protein RadC|nr:DNA repair protein RadC [Bacteroidales bacterium]MBR3428216.1 DNA repair protein RadC [Bacteroidales bacterium]
MAKEKKTIKEWALDDRPREKMIAKGKAALSNAELLAILIGSGNSELSAVDLSRAVLDKVGNDLIALSNLSLNELMDHKGIGAAKAVSIMAALELGKRRRGAEASLPEEVKDSKTSFERFLSHIDDMKQEHFLVMYLDQSFHELKVECISNGGTTNVIADPRIIFKHALNHGATCIILGHNHPSGNPRPSKDDRQLTQKIVSAGKLLDIAVIDHIIIGNERYYSFRDHGEMTY